MILAWLIVILMAGGILAWIAAKVNHLFSRWISLLTLIAGFIIILSIWLNNYNNIIIPNNSQWILELKAQWIPNFGISFHLALDGLSLLLIVLTLFLGILSVITSWKEIKDNVGFFHFNILWILAGIVGVFLSMDLFLFYFFWEVMLIPMFFLIGIWGHEKRRYAAFKFFIFTQASGLLMLLAILALYFIHGAQTGLYTFNYFDLLGTTLSSSASMLIMLGFLIAFIVKLPAFPFHVWLPDAHTEAPTAGSVILAGLLLKTGAYGILRFVIPFFRQASIDFAPYAMTLGVIGILYGAKLAFAQTDFKRLVAYSSVSHMGFVLLGAFSFNELAYKGVVMQMITHGISTGALFILVGSLQERIHTRDLNKMGGLWEKVPRMGGIALLFTMASLGLPGLGNFIAEFLTLAGSYQANILLTVIASVGLVASAVYSLRIMQKVFYGNQIVEWNIPDFNMREMIIMISLAAAIIWLGIFPQPVLNTADKSIRVILQEDVKKIIYKNEKDLKIFSDKNIQFFNGNNIQLISEKNPAKNYIISLIKEDKATVNEQ